MKGTGRDEFGVIIRNEKDQVDKAGVKVELGVEATTEQVLADKPDVVIVATGSVPKKHPVGGADGPAIFNVWQVLNGEAELGQKVCLIDYDGHQRATATAEFLANQGKKVHIITSSLFIGAELGPTQDLYLVPPAAAAEGGHLHPGHRGHGGRRRGGEPRPSRASMSTPTSGTSGVRSTPSCWPWGSRSMMTSTSRLKGKVKELYRIGDCVAPRKVDMAIWEGHKLGREI